MSLLYPSLKLRHLPSMLGLALVGAVIAGAYGVVHDQITYTLSHEYFTAFKFDQFGYLVVPGRPERVVVGMIGFMATWWVGLLSGWFLARVTVPYVPLRRAIGLCVKGFGIVLGVAVVGGVTGAAFGTWRMNQADMEVWADLARGRELQHLDHFVRVAFIHNGSYLGGFLGLLLACGFARRWRHENAEASKQRPGANPGGS